MPTQKLVINTLDIREDNFQGKPVTKWIVNGKWSAFKGNWNADWKVGGMASGIFTEKISNGRTYYNISCPPELRQQYGGGNRSEGPSPLVQEVKKIYALLQKMAQFQGMPLDPELTPEGSQVTPEPASELTQPSDDSQVKLEDIPF